MNAKANTKPNGVLSDYTAEEIEYAVSKIPFLKTVDSVLAKDQRVELIPTKDGVRVIHVKRVEVKAK